MSACRPHAIEALLHGELSPARAARLRRHLRDCPRCHRETAWQRAERRVFVERAQRDTRAAPSFEAFVAYRDRYDTAAIPSARQPSRQRHRWMAFALAACAALALLVARGSRVALPAISREPVHVVPPVADGACDEASCLEELECRGDDAPLSSSEEPISRAPMSDAPLCSMPADEL